MKSKTLAILLTAGTIGAAGLAAPVTAHASLGISWQQNAYSAMQEAAKEADKEEKEEERKAEKEAEKTEKKEKKGGVYNGPSGKETYYNLDMSRCIQMMRENGINGNYWVRQDGVKMYGDYVMCAANLSVRPKGTVVMTSLGQGIVIDTGSFADSNPYQLDIATAW